MRRPFIAGNWKMHNTCAESVTLVSRLTGMLSGLAGVDVVVAPPFTALTAVASVLTNSTIALAAQNMFWEEKGAFTGEIAPAMLKEAGCTYVIIGHSERRQYFHETDETVNRRLKTALRASLIPIVCIGETLAEREADKTFGILERQIRFGLIDLSLDEIGKVIIAYEPVWAIGTGRTATPEQAQEVHGFIRKLIAQLFSREIADRMRILYGGSVKPDNIDQLMAQEDIDGALVGGASLKAEDFARIAQFKA
jgi:triosephosphate isomerase